MNIQQKLLVLMVVLVLNGLMNSASGQNASPEERASRLSEWMKENLELTDEQYSDVQAINLRYAYKMEDVRNSEQARDEKMKIAQSLHLAREDEWEKILTDEQFNLYEEKKGEMMAEFKEKVGRARARR